jgi:NAD(P)-dependent dehydrogenase (short-subunit alcohol dehydrogenase family)
MRNSDKQLLMSIAAGVSLLLVGRAVVRRCRAYDFAGRNVVITGASRGLGLVLARRISDEGANVILCARDEAELNRAVGDLQQRGANVTSFVCDVTDAESIRSTVRQIVNDWGPVDVLVNNAGIIQCGPMETMTCDDYGESMKTHFYGPLNMVEAVLPEMRNRREGRIVNISSIGGLLSVPHLLPYCASKFALVGYSLGLTAEAAKDGIVVTTICPGLMRTGSPRNATFKGQHRAEYGLFKISDSLPIVSMSAKRAARQIVDACRYGTAFKVLGCPAKLSAKIAALAPGLTATALGLVNRVLPEGRRGSLPRRGYESESPLSESWLTALTQRAAVRNNEL